MKNEIFYLREISESIDSGMSLQVINDYGHMSSNNKVYIPINHSNHTSDNPLDKYLAKHYSKINIIPLKSHKKRVRRIKMLFSLLRNINKINLLVIRERKHLLVARALRRFKKIRIITELHEGGLPGGFNKKYQKYLSCVDGIVFTTPSQISYLEKLEYKVPDRYCVLPNGVNTELYSKAAPQQIEESYIITYTGQFTSWKNIPLLFKSLALLPQHYHLRLAGGKINGNSNDYIKTLAEEHDVVERVEYLGFLHPSKLIEKSINGSSVLVVPLGDSHIAKYATSPMKLIEYMATGIPIVAVNHPSVVALSDEGSLHLSSTNPQEFANKIIEATKEDKKKKHERIRKMNSIVKKYSHHARAKKYTEWLIYIRQQTH